MNPRTINALATTVLATLGAATACRPPEQQGAARDSGAAGDSGDRAETALQGTAAGHATASPRASEGWTLVRTIRGFDRPESVRYDSTLDVYFVSNTAGEREDRKSVV